MITVAVPLTWAFQSMYKVWQVEQKLDSLAVQVDNKQLHLHTTQIQIKRSETYLNLEVSSASEVTYADVVALKEQLEKLLNTTVRLDVTPRISL